MGQQQLLLLVLGIVLVGLAVVVGIQRFNEARRQATIDQLVFDLRMTMETIRVWSEKPAALGGPRNIYAFSNFTFAQVGYGADRVFSGGAYPGTCMTIPGGILQVDRGYVYGTGRGYLQFTAANTELRVMYRGHLRDGPNDIFQEPTYLAYNAALMHSCAN